MALPVGTAVTAAAASLAAGTDAKPPPTGGASGTISALLEVCEEPPTEMDEEYVPAGDDQDFAEARREH